MITSGTTPRPQQDEIPETNGAIAIDVRSVTRAVGWAGAGQLASQIAWFGSLIVLGVLLPPRDFGIVAAGVVMVSIASLFIGSGTIGSVIAGEELTRAQVRATLIFNVACGSVLWLAVALLAGPIVNAFARGADPWVIRALASGLLLTSFSLVPRAIFQKRMQFKRVAAVQTSATLIGGVGAVVAAFAGAGVWALVLRILLSTGFTSLFGWISVWSLLPRDSGRSGFWATVRRLRRHGARWFLLLATAEMFALSVDNLIVGHLTNSTQLGLYSLAFTLAFAPLTQVSWQVGAVLFSVSAATDATELIARRAVRALRMTALVLLPLLPPAILLAPVLVPWVLGHRWQPMVTPFQILLGAGVLYAMTNMIGEAFSGSGNIAARSAINAVWCVATIGLLVTLVKADGIRGAAWAHLALSVPLAIAYMILASRRLGAGAGRIWAALRDVVRPVALQGASSLAAIGVLRLAGLPYSAAAVVGVGTGAIAALAMLLASKSNPLGEGKAMLTAALRGGAVG
jgi:O-antigen/teichoic acid export membrane protein